MVDRVLERVAAEESQSLGELFEWLRIESVSADPAREGEVRRAGEWAARFLREAGLDHVALMETGGHPAVYGDWLHAPGRPTLLVYGHYDVQPEDPREKWTVAPFNPVVRDGAIWGRGTSDDKAQVMTHLVAIRAWLRTHGRLPCNIKVFIEGEEEGGKGGTHDFVRNHRDLLACDAVLISDTAWERPDQPTVVYALRGIAYFQVDVQGPSRDLHSGVYGGMVSNPLNGIGRLIAALQNERGQIQVPGFYDDVLPLTPEEREEFGKVSQPDSVLMEDIGVSGLFGEEGYTSRERNWGRPSFDVHGVWGGFAGAGGKTVLPAEGGFKFSFRLVPNQRPERVAQAVQQWLPTVAPAGLKVQVTYLHGGSPVMVPRESPFLKAALEAMEAAFGKRPVLVREGASIPITAVFQEALNAPALLVGYGLNSDNIHSPDEKFPLDHFRKGIRCGVALYARLAEVTP